METEQFFGVLQENKKEIEGSDRLEITVTEKVTAEAKRLYAKIGEVGDALVFESEMHTVNTYDLNIVDEHLDVLEHSLRLFTHEKNVITWGEEGDGAFTLVIMPRAVEEVLQEKVFSKKIPYIFSSATLSDNDSFAFTANSLGVKDYLSFSVASPFDYEEQMTVNLLPYTKENEWKESVNIHLKIYKKQMDVHSYYSVQRKKFSV